MTGPVNSLLYDEAVTVVARTVAGQPSAEAQAAMAKALVQAADNALARLSGHFVAYRNSLDRSVFHHQRMIKTMPRARRAR